MCFASIVASRQLCDCIGNEGEVADIWWSEERAQLTIAFKVRLTLIKMNLSKPTSSNRIHVQWVSDGRLVVLNTVG
jgi:hypothetical protein